MSPHALALLFVQLNRIEDQNEKIIEQNKHLDINLKKLSLYVENHECEPKIQISGKPKAKSIKKYVKKIRP